MTPHQSTLAIRVLPFLFILVSLFSKTLSSLFLSHFNRGLSHLSLSLHFHSSILDFQPLSLGCWQQACLDSLVSATNAHIGFLAVAFESPTVPSTSVFAVKSTTAHRNYKQVTSSHFLFLFASFHDSCWFIVEHFGILIMGTKPSEVWVIGGLTSFIFARFVSLDWWMLTVVGVWHY